MTINDRTAPQEGTVKASGKLSGQALPPIESLRGLRILGVRHHSPACALGVREAIRRRTPALVLVEGPRDATALIDYLAGPEARAPFAIHALLQPSGGPAARTGEEPRSAFAGRQHRGAVAWPFVDYSPELVALREARARGVPAAFCDLPAAGRHETDPQEDPDRPLVREAHRRLAEAEGFRTFDEWWEARIEQATDHEQVLGALLAYGEFLREADPPTAECRAREASMVAHALAAVERGVPAEDILVLVGAYHAAAFAADPPERALLVAAFAECAGFVPAGSALALPLAPDVTLVPYSFRRISDLAGYGAGTRAPAYYQAVWAAGGGPEGFHQATARAFSALRSGLFGEGYAASLADVIEAQRLAQQLAGLRDKPAPGLFELAAAAQSTVAHGRSEILPRHLDAVLTGFEVGRVPTGLPLGPLQAEFYREAGRLALPVEDRPRELDLRLADPRDAERSLLLHRLALLEVPYAEALKLGNANGAAGDLTLVREKWQVAWTPLIDTRLVEAQTLGDGLAPAAARVLRDALAGCADVAQAAEILLRAVLAGAEDAYAEVLAALDRFSAEANDLTKLARAASQVSTLRRYQMVRPVPKEPLAALLERLYVRGALAVADAVDCGPDAVDGVADALRTLTKLPSLDGLCDPALFGRALVKVAGGACPAHPRLRGLALGLLVVLGLAGEGEVRATLREAVGPSVEPGAAAEFLGGLLEDQRTFVIGSQTLVACVNDYVTALPGEGFARALPLLRRAFAGLSQGDARLLVGQIERILRGEAAEVTAAVASRAPAEVLAAVDRLTAALVARWREAPPALDEAAGRR